MAKQPKPGEGLSDQQQAASVQIGKMMGPHMDEFDEEVQRLHDQRHRAEHDADDGTYGQGEEEGVEEGPTTNKFIDHGLGGLRFEASHEKMKQAQAGPRSRWDRRRRRRR